MLCEDNAIFEKYLGFLELYTFEKCKYLET